LLAFFSGVEFDETESSWSTSFSVGWDFDIGGSFEFGNVEEVFLGGVPREVSAKDGSGFSIGHFCKLVS